MIRNPLCPMAAESAESLPESGAPSGWQLGGPEELSQDWEGNPDCVTSDDSESEDVMHAVDPNRVFGAAAADASSESDSGVSEETPVTSVTAVTTATWQPEPPAVYQSVYDISSVGGASAEPGQENIISIESDDWSSQSIFSDSCVVSESPAASSSSSSPSDGQPSSAPTSSRHQSFPDSRSTEEEQKSSTEEGVSSPSNLPLTKAEERVSKKVRRKIRNKQSAQDSRRRRKEYIQGSESRAAACSAQNQESQRTVEQSEKHNKSSSAQSQQLRSLIKQTASKGAQTSTCLSIISVSLISIISPSLSPFSRRPSPDDDYRTGAVVSRNISTDPNSPDPTDGGPADRLDSSASPPLVVGQSGPAGGAAGDGGQSENGTAAVAGQNNATGQRRGPGKPGHADEM